MSEEEREVIDLGRVEAAMQAAITALKWEFSNTLVTRLTPGTLHISYLETTLLMLQHFGASATHKYLHTYIVMECVSGSNVHNLSHSHNHVGSLCSPNKIRF